MTIHAWPLAVAFGALLGALITLCSYVASQAAGELRLLGWRALGHAVGRLGVAGWFAGLALWYLAVAIVGGLWLFGLLP